MTVAPHPTRPLRIISADRAAIAFSAPAGADHLPDANESQGLGLHLPQDLHQITAVAIGILIARRRCTPQQALAKLIDLATKTDRSVLDIAEHLITHYTRPAPVDPDRGTAGGQIGARGADGVGGGGRACGGGGAGTARSDRGAGAEVDRRP